MVATYVVAKPISQQSEACPKFYTASYGCAMLRSFLLLPPQDYLKSHIIKSGCGRARCPYDKHFRDQSTISISSIKPCHLSIRRASSRAKEVENRSKLPRSRAAGIVLWLTEVRAVRLRTVRGRGGSRAWLHS